MKAVWLYLVLAAMALVLPLKEGIAWFRAPKIFQANLVGVKPISAPGRHYIDALPTGENRVDGIFLSPDDQFLSDRFEFQSGKWVQTGAGKPVPEAFSSAPYAPVNLRRGNETLAMKGDSLAWSRAPGMKFPPDGSPAIDGEWGRTNIFYTRVVDGSYRVVMADEKGRETNLPFPEKRGHAYLPIRWEAGRLTFYQGVGYLDRGNKADGFIHRLFLLPDEGGLAVLPLGLVDKPVRRAYSVGGSPDGAIFAHVSGFLPDRLFVYDREACPYPIPASSNQSTALPYTMPVGLSLAAHPRIKYYHHIAFAPEGGGRVYLIGAEGEGRELALWDGTLKTRFLRVHPWGKGGIFALGSLILMTLMIFFAIRAVRGPRTTML